jgi:hypothetical protein
LITIVILTTRVILKTFVMLTKTFVIPNRATSPVRLALSGAEGNLLLEERPRLAS